MAFEPIDLLKEIQKELKVKYWLKTKIENEQL